MGAPTPRAPSCLGTRVSVGTETRRTVCKQLVSGLRGRFPLSCSEGCRIPAGLFICYLASGQGLPGERSPPPLPVCLSQRTPIKGTNWTAIHQSPPLRLAPRSSGGPVVRLLFYGTGSAPGSRVGRRRRGAGTHTHALHTHAPTRLLRSGPLPETLAFPRPSSGRGWVHPTLPFEVRENCIDSGLPALREDVSPLTLAHSHPGNPPLRRQRDHPSLCPNFGGSQGVFGDSSSPGVRRGRQTRAAHGCSELPPSGSCGQGTRGRALPLTHPRRSLRAAFPVHWREPL